MSLKVWLPLNGDLHNQGTSNPNISLVSENTWASSGKIGSNSLTLTKLQTVLSTSSCMTGAKEISYSYWVKVNTAWSANWLDGIRWTETDGSATSTARQEFYTNCTLIGTWYKGGSISGKTFTPGVWTHLAATINYNTGEAKFYINGILSGTTTNVDTTYYCRGDFYIGDNGTDICENDVRIYDHCLSAAEVREISQGLVLHYKLDDISTTNVEDSSGYNNNGTRAGTISAYTDSPRYSQCMNLSAAASRINCGRGGMVTDAITVNFWANLPTVPSALSDTTGFVSCAESGGFRIQIGNNALVRTIIYINSAYAVIEGSTAIQANTWYMITLVYDRMNSKLYEYINGIKDAELDVANNKIIGYNSGNVLWIGAEARSGTSYYSAIAEEVSDFRIYCTALDADAIRQLYEVGAKVDNKQNLHTYEIKETNNNLLAGRLWTSSYSSHNPITYPFTNFNSQGEYQFTTNGAGAGTEYIPINPTGHTYYYDYTISVNAGNQFYIGFERYDIDKTSRSNNACVYTTNIKPSSDLIKQHYKGTVNLSTDGVNPCAFIALRILNGWSGTASGVTGTATIHNISLREVSTLQISKITKTGQFIEEEIKEEDNMKIQKNGIIETNEIIEL